MNQPPLQEIQELLRDMIIFRSAQDVTDVLNYIERNAPFFRLNDPLPASANTNNVEETPLTLAVNHDRQDIVDILLATPRIIVNQPNGAGQTPLEIAKTRPDTGANRTIREHIIGTLLKSYIYNSDENAITNLLQNNNDFDINAPLFHSNGNTPLILAIILYDQDNVNSQNVVDSLLLSEDIDVDVNTPRQTDGNTPLMFAIMSGHNSTMVETLLSQPGMNINLTNQVGQTALAMAELRGDQSIIDSLNSFMVSEELRSAVSAIEETKSYDRFG